MDKNTLTRGTGVFTQFILYAVRLQKPDFSYFPAVLSPECSQAALLVLRHVTVVPPDGEEEEHYRVLMRLIHDLSFRLVSAKVLASRDVPLPNLVERFMILFSRKVDGSGWRTCADMSTRFSYFQWHIRAVVTEDAMRAYETDPDKYVYL